MYKRVFERDGAFPITVIQTGKDRFKVTYGAEEWRGDYAYAAHKLGEALFHSFACEGSLNND